MPSEIEAKFRIAQPELLRCRLRKLSAVFAGHVLEMNRMFDTSAAQLRTADCGLRIRTCQALGPCTPAGAVPPPRLTYKGPRTAGPVKSREELEIDVGDPARLAEILARLGFREVLVYEKRRELWRVMSCEIAVDELPQLGWWVEIEGPDAASIAQVRDQLGLSETSEVRETYVEMAAAHSRPDAHGCRRLAFSDS